VKGGCGEESNHRVKPLIEWQDLILKGQREEHLSNRTSACAEKGKGSALKIRVHGFEGHC